MSDDIDRQAAPDAHPPEDREPVVPAVAEDRIGVLAAYVRTNRDRFTDEALRGAARKAGYTEAEIAAAWASAASRTPIPSERRTNAGVVAGVAVGYVIALYGGGALLGSIGVGDIAAGGALALIVAGIAGWALLKESRPSMASGLGWGVLLAVGLPLIIVLGILGICIVFGVFSRPLTG
ncbi:MAG TPA: hypothetical protein VK867_11855 [Candidatus Limnocylindrales bacterium]|nr:hypothetical protein [Candidatus Limnocylindrales bacterium]